MLHAESSNYACVDKKKWEKREITSGNETGCNSLLGPCNMGAVMSVILPPSSPLFPLSTLRNVKQLWNTLIRERVAFSHALVPFPKKVSTASAFVHLKVSSPIGRRYSLFPAVQFYSARDIRDRASGLICVISRENRRIRFLIADTRLRFLN